MTGAEKPMACCAHGLDGIELREAVCPNTRETIRCFTLREYLPEIAWETEVWIADAPEHLIHFNGECFLGPYERGR